MDLDVAPVGRDVQVVDPEVRAHVYSLVTALGGFNGEDASKYCLGDDALACLRDIKKWLKLYDDKTNRLDVARCLAESNLVNGDLLPILATWRGNGQNKKHLTRVALACLELMVPMTWPVEIHSQMTVNHHRHTPYLQQAQVHYKRGILDKNAGLETLRAVIQIGLPSLALPRIDRTARDEGILKLMLYLFRNVVMISPPRGLAAEGDEEETSRSATINAFQEQDVFALLLTMCSNMGSDFSFQDVIVMEILFHLVKGVDVKKLFMNDAQRSVKQKDELSDLLQKETGVKREYSKNAPTRHGRFGTMIWVKRDDAKVSTVSGQDVLKDGQAALIKMDQSKKWNRPKHHGRKREIEAASGDFNSITHLTPLATKNLRTFVEEFLDTGFNPLFIHVRKAIEREAERFLDIHTRQFLYLVSWFLQADRVRRETQRKEREKDKGTSRELEPDSYSIIAGVLDQETFVFLNRAMQHSYDHKDWQDLNANMRCFTQILLTVQEMAASPLEEDQEIAENIQNRIFYEEITHDRVLAIVRGYQDQGFGYLDACTELLHVFVRMLENYSKQNVDMHIRSKRRARRVAKENPDKNKEKAENDEEVASAEEDMVDAVRVTKERKFDFKRFAARFCNQKSVDTFVKFTAYYRELDEEQLKRAHRFFYRVAFKQEMSVLLMRVDILSLFYRMIKGPGALDKSKPIYRDWEELVKQVTRKTIKKLDQRSALITELLFSKINSTLYFLEYGQEKQTISANTRPPAELEVHPRVGDSRENKVSVVVAALIMDDRISVVTWLSEQLGSAAAQRSTWEAGAEIRRLESSDGPEPPSPPIELKLDDDSIRTAMFRNGKLRLLVQLIGLERVGTEDVLGAPWIIPSSISSTELEGMKSCIDKGLQNRITEYDGVDPRQQIRQKRLEDPKQILQEAFKVNLGFGSDSEGEDILPDGPLFPPNIRSRSNALEQLKKSRRKRQRSEDKEPLDEATLEERRRNREENARARTAKIKSDLFVHDSDDESDEDADREFFANEEALRKAQGQRIREVLVSKALEEDAALAARQKAKKSNRKPTSISDSDSDDDNDDDERDDTEARKRPRVSRSGFELDDPVDEHDEDDDILMTGIGEMTNASSTGQSFGEDDATPLTSAEDGEWGLDKELDLHKDLDPSAAVAEDDQDDDDAPVNISRRRGRAGFVIDSDSE